jgi:hypothetical protein
MTEYTDTSYDKYEQMLDEDPLALRDLARSQAALLEEAAKHMIWMTGASDFGPGGQAQDFFVKEVRPFIWRLVEATT